MLDGGLLTDFIEGIDIKAVKLLPVPDMLTFDVLPNIGNGSAYPFGQQLHGRLYYNLNYYIFIFWWNSNNNIFAFFHENLAAEHCAAVCQFPRSFL